MSRLEYSRRRFEGAWKDLQLSLKRELGGAPRWRKNWLLPVVGLAAGLAMAYLVRERTLPEGRKRIGRPEATPRSVED